MAFADSYCEKVYVEGFDGVNERAPRAGERLTLPPDCPAVNLPRQQPSDWEKTKAKIRVVKTVSGRQVPDPLFSMTYVCFYSIGCLG